MTKPKTTKPKSKSKSSKPTSSIFPVIIYCLDLDIVSGPLHSADDVDAWFENENLSSSDFYEVYVPNPNLQLEVTASLVNIKDK